LQKVLVNTSCETCDHFGISYEHHAAIFYFYATNAPYEDYPFCQKIISKCEDHMPKEKAKAFDILHLDVGVI
jgi:hypothetical protein